MASGRYGFPGLLVAALSFYAGAALSQSYPSKIVRIVTSLPGGDTDFKARLVAPVMAGALGQQVIIDNRPSGIIPAQVVAKSPPDGYTVLIAGTSLWVGPFLEDTPYDPVADFAPVALMTTSINILCVHPSLPVKSVKELIALAKARPGELNYGSGATGASTHLAAELFKNMAAVDIVRVRYKSGGQRMNALVSGETQVQLEGANVLQFAKAGKLRAIAVTGTQPSALAPDLPTIAASGVPGYAWTGMTGMFAPPKTSAAVIDRLYQETTRALNQADVKAKIFNAGEEVVGGSPDTFGAAIKSEMSRLGKLIREAKLRDQP